MNKESDVSIEKLKLENAVLKRELQKLDDKYEKLRSRQQETAGHLHNYMVAYNSITKSGWWRITKPFRFVGDKIKAFLRKFAFFRKLKKGFRLLFTVGPKETLRRFKKEMHIGPVRNYYAISDEQRKNEEAVKFDKDIKFSILVPLYNTPIKFLEDMIVSVQKQTYKNWELCLADGSDDQHGEVGEFVKKLQEKDSRIVYKKLEKNMGISENTNACIDMATGEYIALFDHDDILHPSALYENMIAICNHGADFMYTDEATFEGNDITNIITMHYKPDYAVDNLRSNNYICHFSVFSRELLNKAGRFRHEYDGSQDHDMILRLTENASKVFHIRKLLYFWRSHKASVAADINSKPYAIEAGKKAVHDSIVRTTGRECKVFSSRAFPTIYNVEFELVGEPMISIIIPNYNHLEDLKKCIDSIILKTTYDNYEIIVVENNSDDKELFEYYEYISTVFGVRVIKYEKEFNYSDINNVAVEQANGEYVVLLNNDTEIITLDWLQQLLMYAQRDDVAAVGAKLLYPDNTIQHAGIIIGMGEHRTAGHENYGVDNANVGYMGRLCYARNTSAVTGACLMIRKALYQEVGGLDTSFAVAFNDVDFCLRLREKGYLNVFTPMAELYHYESISRGSDTDTKNVARFEEECEKFRNRWKKILDDGDPYFNPHFSLDYSDYRLK